MKKRQDLFIPTSAWVEYADDFNHVMTINDICEMYPISPSSVMYAIEHDHLCAMKLCRVWLISSRSVADWIVKRNVSERLYK